MESVIMLPLTYFEELYLSENEFGGTCSMYGER